MTKSLAERAAEALEKARQLEAEAVLADPDGHFPYKRDDAVRHGVTEEMADYSEQLLAAQEARLKDPGNPEKVAAEQKLVSYVQRLVASRRPVPDTHEVVGMDEDGFPVLARKGKGQATVAATPTTETDGE